MELTPIIRLFFETFFVFLLNPLFWLIVALVSFQYRRLARTEAQLLGRPKYRVVQQIVYSTVFGLAGGLLASALLFVLGINLMEIGIIYVWPLAILLLLVHPRYLCFAYAGGIVGATAAVLQLADGIVPLPSFMDKIAAVHIPGLLALIGILHLTESFLIAVSGHLFPAPVYLKTAKGIIGGFSLQKFWPLPLVGLMASVVYQSALEGAGAMLMPDWWPVFASKLTVGAGQTLMYMTAPIVAGLGYGDVAASSTPRVKSKSSALNLGLYSVALISIAFLAFRFPFLTLPAALFAPFGHEFLIIAGNRKEFSREPLFRQPDYGVAVMDFFPGSEAEAAGLRAGDVIYMVNSIPVNDTLTFRGLMSGLGTAVELDVIRDGEYQHIRFSRKGDGGIIPVPDRYAPAYMEVKHTHFLTALADKVRRARSSA